jgi:hypothetical protein
MAISARGAAEGDGGMNGQAQILRPGRYASRRTGVRGPKVEAA